MSDDTRHNPMTMDPRQFAAEARTELEDRLQELAWRLTTQRDELQAAYDRLGPLLVAQANENVALRAEIATLQAEVEVLRLQIEVSRLVHPDDPDQTS